MRKVREVYRKDEKEIFAVLHEEDGHMSASSFDKEVEENLNRYFKECYECGKKYGDLCSLPQHLAEIKTFIFNYASRWDHSTTFIMSEVREEREAAAG